MQRRARLRAVDLRLELEGRRQPGRRDRGRYRSQALADASPRTSGDRFKAWLSQGGAFAQDRITRGLEPYRRVDDVLVAMDWTALTSGTLLKTVWTATHTNGTGSGANCNNWSNANAGSNGQIGATGTNAGGWTDTGNAPCNASLRIYCIED